MKTIIAAFSDQPAAQDAIAFLQARNVNDVELIGSDASSGSMTRLRAFNVPDDRARLYAEVLRRGAVLVVAHTDHDARELANELDRRGSLDLDKASDRWRESGWAGYDPEASQFDANASAAERRELMRENAYEGEALGSETGGRNLDVIEERVKIGKREVPREAVRVRTFISERPVREQVELTEERINIERERVDQPIPPAAADSALTEDEFVVTARGEEAVVGKEARVVERVHVGKTTDTRVETVEETERRRDVEAQPVTETKTDVRTPRR
jgi:hypothetical protein